MVYFDLLPVVIDRPKDFILLRPANASLPSTPAPEHARICVLIRACERDSLHLQALLLATLERQPLRPPPRRRTKYMTFFANPRPKSFQICKFNGFLSESEFFLRFLLRLRVSSGEPASCRQVSGVLSFPFHPRARKIAQNRYGSKLL